MRPGPQAKIRAFALALCVALIQNPAHAQQTVGAVTNLDLPRFVSMKTAEAYARRGPGKSHRVDWKFVRRNMPLKVVAEHGHWRRVVDNEGKGGWIHYALLSRSRSVMIIGTDVEMFSKPAGLSRLVAKLQPGVVGKLIDCTKDLCDIETTDQNGKTYTGWVQKSALWGLTEAD